MNLAALMLQTKYLEEDVDRYQRRLSDLERAAVVARENRAELHPAHAEIMAQTRNLLTLATRAVVRSREALR